MSALDELLKYIIGGTSDSSNASLHELATDAAAEFADLRNTLVEAIELAEETVGYAGSYFQKKWHLNSRLDELRSAAARLEEYKETP